MNAHIETHKRGVIVKQISLSLLFAFGVMGCGNGSTGGKDGGGGSGGGGGGLPPVASQISLASGDGQAAPIGAVLMLPLVVRVSADDHRPVPNTTVNWAVATGGGAVSAATSTTDADGLAKINATLGAAAGANTFTATAAGLTGSPVTFTATGKPAAKLTIVSGDGQTGTAGSALAQPLVVLVSDGYGNPVSGIDVAWTAPGGGGSITPAMTNTGADGKAMATATLGGTALASTFQADVNGLTGSPAQFVANRTSFKLVYTDPAAGGKIRLVKNAASTATTVVLDLVTSTALTGWATGFNLPIDTTRVGLNATPIVKGAGLDPGSAPAAMKAAVPASGPLKGMLVSGLSQKAAGTGAAAADATLASGTVLYSIKLDLIASAPTGVVFDGTAGGFTLPSGGLRDKAGQAVAGPADVLIGKLEITK